MRLRYVPLLLLVFSGCTAMQRSDDAAAARQRMIGMSAEDVLACMGPPKKKAEQGKTEVWQYLSGDNQGNGVSSHYSSNGYGGGLYRSTRNYCYVDVVMKSGAVRAVNYVGPASSEGVFFPDDECGYAVRNCVR